jgi:hypothetical protein
VLIYFSVFVTLSFISGLILVIFDCSNGHKLSMANVNEEIDSEKNDDDRIDTDCEKLIPKKSVPLSRKNLPRVSSLMSLFTDS